MAQIDAWLFARLKIDDINDAADGLLGANKVYPIYAPQNAAEPFITYSRSGTQRDYTTRKNDGVPTVTFQINCWDTNYVRLKTWADAVRVAIDGYRQDADGFVVRSAFVTDEADNPEPPATGQETPLYGVQFTLDVTHTETVTTY